MLWKYRKSLPALVPIMLQVGLQMSGIEIPWLGYLLIVLAILGAIYFVYSLRKERQLVKTKAEQTNLIVEHLQGISNVLHIERQEPSNRPPSWMSVGGIIASLLLLTLAGFVTYPLFSGVIVAKFDWQWIAFYLLFGVLPLWLLLEPFADRKYYKSGRSAIAIDVTFVVNGDITDVFNRCANILETMKAKIIRKNTPNLVKAHINKSNISVEVSPRDDNIQVYVVSDATWVTVKIGKGRNQRIIDEFQKHFIDGFRVSKLDNTELSLTKALDWVTCDKCGLIGVRNIKTRELEEVEDNQRNTGQPILTRSSSLGDTEPRHENIPECIMQAEDFTTLPPLSSQPLPLFYMQLPRQCPHFIKWQKGSSPKEHKEMIDRQPSGYGIQPIIAEPEISIDIDKCSVSHYGQSDQAIEVALTLRVKSPPVNITDVQLYMGDEMLKLLSPTMPITQRDNKECYIAKYKLSLTTIYEVDKDKRDKYHICAVAMGQKFSSKVFSINNP